MTEESEKVWENAKARLDTEFGPRYIVPMKQEIVQITNTDPPTVTVMITFKNNGNRDVNFAYGRIRVPWGSTVKYISHPIVPHSKTKQLIVLNPEDKQDYWGVMSQFMVEGLEIKAGETKRIMYTLFLHELGYCDTGPTYHEYPYQMYYRNKDDVMFQFWWFGNDVFWGLSEKDIPEYTALDVHEQLGVPVGIGSWLWNWKFPGLAITPQMIEEEHNPDIDPYAKHGLPKYHVKTVSYMYEGDKWYYLKMGERVEDDEMACPFGSLDEVKQEICKRILADPDIADSMELAQYTDKCPSYSSKLNEAANDIVNYTVDKVTLDELKDKWGCIKEEEGRIPLLLIVAAGALLITILVKR